MRRLMGMEIELGIMRRSGDGVARAGAMATSIVRRAARHRPHLPHASNGIFFDTGDRFYVDQGAHPEWCTPECSDMTDVVHYVRAAERRLEAVLHEVPDVMLLRSNIDYASRATWGCHESHLHRIDPELLRPVLIPHLVSRLVYAGAGGLNPYDPGIAPCLSPRALNFWRRSSCSHVSICDMRDEPLAGLGYRRCHVVLGDTLCADLPLWLRLGTTSLIIAMADAGAISPADLPTLENPVAALHAICVDPTLTAVARTASGGFVTAIDIQRSYLRAASRFAGEAAAPTWAEEVCDAWGVMLDRLDHGPDAVAATCEWAIKREIFLDQAARDGFDAERVREAGGVVTRLQSEVQPEPAAVRRLRQDVAWSVEKRLETLAAPARRHGVNLDELRPYLLLRQRLCEIDVRYGQLPDGIFGAIADTLDHAAPRVDAAGVHRAMHEPPPDTRAGLRGAMIRRLSPAPAGLFAEWTRIDDRHGGRSFVMHDPFATEAEWKTRRAPDRRTGRMLDTVSRLYNAGNFARARVLLRLLLARTPESPPPPAWAWAYRAWIESRTGHVENAEQALEQVEDSDEVEDRIVNRVSVYRFQGLVPDLERMAPWIARGERSDRSARRRETLVSFLGHTGYAYSRHERLEEAVGALRAALEIPMRRPNHLRIAARIRCDLADCLRLTGQRMQARRHLDVAKHIFDEHGFGGDHADHWAPAAVKLAPGDDEARHILNRAFTIQRRLGHPVGAVRTLLLRARLTSFRGVATRARTQVERYADTIPDLRDCPRLGMILTRWDEWSTRYPEPSIAGDPFWLL